MTLLNIQKKKNFFLNKFSEVVNSISKADIIIVFINLLPMVSKGDDFSTKRSWVRILVADIILKKRKR